MLDPKMVSIRVCDVFKGTDSCSVKIYPCVVYCCENETVKVHGYCKSYPNLKMDKIGKYHFVSSKYNKDNKKFEVIVAKAVTWIGHCPNKKEGCCDCSYLYK